MNIDFSKLEHKLDLAIEILAILVVFAITYAVNTSNNLKVNDLRTHDVFYEYSYSVDIQNGVNPYARILGASLLTNDKYATLFPLYYYMLLVVAFISHFSYTVFIRNYRTLLLLSQFVSFGLIYLMFRKKGMKYLGFIAGAYLLLNRWSLNNISDLKQDTLAITLLIASFYFFDSKKRVSYLLYGLSIGIKHIGIFLLPIYILPVLVGERKIDDFLIDMILFATPIVLPAIPFLIDNSKAFLLSLLFSFTRAPAASAGAGTYGYEKLLFYYNRVGKGSKPSLVYLILPRLPLFVFSVINFIALLRRKITRNLYALFSLLIFVTFNPVYFDQYLLWFTPFILLGGLDVQQDRYGKIAS